MLTCPAARLRDHFQTVVDPRVDRTKRHELLDIIALPLCAVLGGADNWVEIAQFGRDKRAWLRTFLALPNGMPSHDTFGRVFAALDPAQFEQGFRSWVAGVAHLTAGAVVASDGKCLRGSHDAAHGQGRLTLVSAWARTHRLTLGQVQVDAASNEIPAIPELLKQLALKGCIVTIAAIGCQTAIAQQIIKQEADYVLALKDNQETLFDEVKRLFREERPRDFAGLSHDRDRTVGKDHGRLELRRTWTVSDPAVRADLNPKERWPNLRSVGMVEAERRIGATTETETRYYISSLPGDAAQFGDAVRGHWSIENSLHWVLDIVFREDHSRVRQGHAAQNLAVVRRLARNLLRQADTAKVGVKVKRLKAAWSTEYLGKVLAHLAT